MKKLVEYLAKSLVERPDQVLLAERSDESMVFYELKVADEDVGRIIGKNGSTIRAVRTVVQAAAASRNLKSRLDVLG